MNNCLWVFFISYSLYKTVSPLPTVGLGYEDIKDRLPESIDAACHNSNSSCTISGPAEDVTAFVEKLKAEEIFAKEVNAGNIAYHSRYITQIGERLNKLLKEVNILKYECSYSPFSYTLTEKK